MRSATNFARMRIKNEKMILSLISKKPISRVEISKITGLTKAAVTIITDDLKNRGIIMEEEVRLKTVGRNPLLLHLNAKAMYFWGIDINRIDITVGLVDLCGNIIGEEIIPVEKPEKAFCKIKEIMGKIIKKHGICEEKIYKTGIAVPGPIDRKTGKILNPPNFNDWHNVSLVDEMSKITDAEVVAENVSNATAIAEKHYGAGRENENFITIKIDEGIGSGIVINDRLFEGTNELGHISVKYDGEKCECGNLGCLEKYASVPAILKKSKYSSWEEVVDNGDDALIKEEAMYLGTAIITANNLFGVETIVLCGDIAYKPQKLISFIKENIVDKIITRKNVTVCEGKIKSQTLVASSVAFDSFLN